MDYQGGHLLSGKGYGFGRGGGGNAIDNGESDVAGHFRITINARPNHELLKKRRNNKNPLFPHLSLTDRRHKAAHKGLLAFQIVTPHNGAFTEQPIGWNFDHGTVTYIDNLNSLFNAGDEKRLWAYTDNIRILGIVERDVGSEPLAVTGTPKNNNIAASGTMTIPNVGPYTITAGQKIMWEMPAKRGAGNNSSVNKISSMETDLVPLMPVPYIPSVHKGSPEMIYNALNLGSGGSGAKMHGMNVGDSSRFKDDAHDVMDSIKAILLVGMMTLEKETSGNEMSDDAVKNLWSALKVGSYQDSFTVKFRDALFKPFDNFIFPRQAPELSDLQSEAVRAANGRARPGGSENENILVPDDDTEMNVLMPSSGWDDMVNFKKKINIMQTRAFHTLYRGIASFETRFRDRIFGVAYSTGSPGKDFDVLLAMSGNGSL